MKKNMKKKILTVTLIIALLSIAVVGGSLAWFTAESEAVENTFTVGSVKIEQKEVFDEDNAQLLPIVNTTTPSKDVNYVKKEVTVENTGKNAAYLRTHIAIPSVLDDYLELDLDLHPNTSWQFERKYAVPVNGMQYRVYTYVHTAALEAEDTTDALLKGVFMNANVDVQVDPDNTDLGAQFCLYNKDTKEYTYSGFKVEDSTNIKVLVLTQAVQADGFANCATALENAFGDPTNDNNPFLNQ